MNYFDTVGGQNAISKIANSLERIALAIERNNKLLEEAIRTDNSDKPAAQGLANKVFMGYFTDRLTGSYIIRQITKRTLPLWEGAFCAVYNFMFR